MGKLKLGIIVGSTRPGRVGLKVGEWVKEQADKHTAFEATLIDLQEQNLPMLDEPNPPMQGEYQHQHTKDWSTKIASFDAFIFVTPEYNHGIPASMKNAVDYLYSEWVEKVVGFVSYGALLGGGRAVEQWRQVISNLHMVAVNQQVVFPAIYLGFNPGEDEEKAAAGMLDAVARWGEAFKQLRQS